MKRHIGKLVAGVGFLLLLTSWTIGPWISRTFFMPHSPDGTPIAYSMTDPVKGTVLCFQGGFLLMVSGAIIEIVQAFRYSRKKEQARGKEDAQRPMDE